MSENLKQYTKQAVLVDASKIVVKNRIRTEFGDLNELATSIRDEGLLHPPVINQNFELIAGERRLRAMRDVLKWVEIPVVFFETLDDAHLARLEGEENVKRLNVNWKERIMSVAKTHRLMTLQNALVSQRWTQAETGKLLNYSQANVAYALKVAEYIEKGDKDIIACESMSDALRKLLERAENARNKQLVALTSKPGHPAGPDILNTPLGTGPVPTPKTDQQIEDEFFSTAPVLNNVFKPGITGTIADVDEMPGVPSATSVASSGPVIPLSANFSNIDGVHDLVRRGFACVDHIICDLPFGVEGHMDNILQEQGGKNIEATRDGHNAAANVDFIKRLIPTAYDALRDGGFFIAFYDLEHHNWIMELGRKSGFKVQDWPLIWAKTHRCSNQAAGFNFTKSHETAFVFRKGNATLLSPQERSVWTGGNELEAKALGHPFAKPFKLWQWIFDAVVQRGQTVYDPCIGRGSCAISALERGLRPMGAELITDDYNALIVNIQNWYKIKDPTVTFS